MSNSLAVIDRKLPETVLVPQRFASSAKTISRDGVKQLMLNYRAAARRGQLAAVVPNFKLQPGMVYTKVRAISARINQNWDAWPSDELRKSYLTFLGKPIFVNHNNFDPSTARGRVVASRYLEKGADKYIEVIQETDGQRYPKLGNEIKTGGLDSVSMGVEAGFTICSYCGNRATDVFDMCDHVKFHKGSYLPDPRTGEPKLVYENCYKLGFFELSYVFDRADETAVVSQVITAANQITHAWNETKAPEDIDTLNAKDKDSSDDDYDFVTPYRPNHTDEANPFHHYLESPEELQEPNLGETRARDRQQEEQGLDDDRLVEDVGEVSAPEQGGAPAERAATKRRKTMARSTRSRRVTAEDEGSDVPPWLQDDDGGGDEGDYAGPDDAGDDGGDDEGPGEDAGPPPPQDDGGDGFPNDDGDSIGDELIDEAEADLEQARAQQNGGDTSGGDYEDPGDGSGPPPEDEDQGGPPPQFQGRRRQPRQARRRTAEDDKDDDDSDDEDDDDKDEDDDKPPWLKEKESRRRSPVRGRTSQKKGRKKGATMGAPRLAERGRTAAQGRRQHFADDNGYTDGGPYGTLDQQGDEEQINSVFGEGDGVPAAEEVKAPTGDESKAPNSEAQLVARIQSRSQALKQDMAAWQQIQARKKPRRARRRTAEDVVEPNVVNPELSGTDDQSLKGDDFQDTGLEDGTVHPTDGDSNNKIGRDQSRQWFAAFDNWLRQTTRRSWNQHSSASLPRLAVRWSKNSGVPVKALMPTLQSALHQARKVEARSGNVRRHAEDTALEVAAPDERTDTTTPVKDDTDERAQSSQFDLGDYGHNAGDDLADPELSSDSQIWAPGEGKRERESALLRKAEGVAAVRCAEAYIKCGLVKPADKWKLAGWLQTKAAHIVEDRTNLLDAVYAANHRAFTAARTPAGRMRGVQTVPPGFGRGRVAATQRVAAEDPINDAAMWL